MTTLTCPKCGKQIKLLWLFHPAQLDHAIANHCPNPKQPKENP